MNFGTTSTQLEQNKTANFVFGYGSLVNLKNLEQYLKRELNPDSDYVICSLKNWQRCWNVAMDNQVNLPEYKYYRDRATRQRLEIFVAFLNLRPCLSKTIRGILFRVSDAELANLDLRERNYQRIKIDDGLDLSVDGNVWTYIGTEEAKQRYQKGLSLNKVAIARDYSDSVISAYESLGERELAEYFATTEQAAIPLIDLEICQTSSFSEA